MLTLQNLIHHACWIAGHGDGGLSRKPSIYRVLFDLERIVKDWKKDVSDLCSAKKPSYAR